MFVWTMAVRFLREGRHQSVLIVVGAAVGVAVMVFLTALIGGVQSNLIDKTLGSISHVTLSEGEVAPRALMAETADTVVFRTVQPPAQPLSTIANWPAHLRSLSALPEITASCPVLSGPGTARKGQGVEPVVVNGVDTERYNRVIPIAHRMATGGFTLRGSDVIIGASLADTLGAMVGDKIRIEGLTDRSAVLTVAGIFDLENREANSRWAFVTLTTAQSLLDVPGGVSQILLRVSDIFQAEEIAGRAAWQTGLYAESWMGQNAELLSALRSQDSSSSMIQFFVVLAVALGIASVLYVSVVQKSKEIGILKAMGTRSATVVRIFIAQGLLVGVIGSLIGCALGAGLAIAFRDLSTDPEGAPLLPIVLTAPLFIRSSVIAFLSSGLAGIAPARRASRLNPVEVIRNG